MIRIVSDSTCDLTEELVNKYNIKIVPLHIVMNDKEYRDRIEITPGEIFDWAEANKTTPKTSAVSYGDTESIFKRILDAGDEIVAFTISEPMSNTANVFRMVARDLGASDRVSVVNSKSLSNGVGILALEAAQMAAEGADRQTIVNQMEIDRDKLHTSFVIETLTYLARGGRCSSATALAGGILKIHPKIILKDGAMEVEKKYRGHMSAVVMNYVKDMEEELLRAKTNRVFLISTRQDPEIVKSVRTYLESLGRFDEIVEPIAGGVISSHCGPGTLGVIFIEE